MFPVLLITLQGGWGFATPLDGPCCLSSPEDKVAAPPTALNKTVGYALNDGVKSRL